MRTSNDIENQIQLTRKFIFGPRYPSWLSKILLLVFFLCLSPCGYSETKTLHYGTTDENFTIYISENQELFLFGGWGDDPVLVDDHVKQVFGDVASFGVILVYRRVNEIRWAILKRENGEKIIEGSLEDILPEEGRLKYAIISPLAETFSVKVVFDTDHYTVYKLDLHGKKEVIRQGKLEKK